MYRDGKWQETMMAAFIGVMGAYRSSGKPQFGIGLVREDDHGSSDTRNFLFWGSDKACCLVTAWRAAQLLDMMEEVQGNILFSAFAVCQRIQPLGMQSCLQALSRAIPGRPILELRSDMLERWCIGDGELDEMLRICNDPESQLKVSVQELEEELLAGIIYCTPEVCRAFNRAQSEGYTFSLLKEESRKVLPPQQSLEKFCKEAKIRRLRTLPVDEQLMQDGLMGLDQRVVYTSYRCGSGRRILCCVKHGGQSERVGNPVIRMRGGDEWILDEALYRDKRMLVKVRILSGWDRGGQLLAPIDELVWRAPRMVGVAYGDGDYSAENERRSKYVSTEPLWRKLLHCYSG